MTKPFGWTGACVVLLGLVAACGGEKKSGAKSAGASAAAGATASATTPPPGEPGALSKPLAQYTGDELYAFAHGLNFTGGVEADRRCRGQAACRGTNPTLHARLRVDAVAGEDSLSPSSLPANGVIAVRALNHGQVADSVYNTRPGTEYEYYLIVAPAGNGARWTLEELTTTANGRAHRTVSSGTVKGCGHQFVRGARADFKTCDEAARLHQASFPPLPQGGVSDSPIWWSCAEGCCTADGPSIS